MELNVYECSGIELSIVRAYRTKKKRNWDRLYFAVDLHDTITQSTYTRDEVQKKAFFPGAIETLKYFSSCKDIILILNTSSFPIYLKEYYRQFEENEIYFDYLNENPEVPSTDVGDFGKKFYFNILMDDKAGFNPLKDWDRVLKLVKAFEEDEVTFVTQDFENYLDFKIS
jgi:hypothetical protein